MGQIQFHREIVYNKVLALVGWQAGSAVLIHIIEIEIELEIGRKPYILINYLLLMKIHN